MKRNVIIIGAGPGGLAAAMLLARSGIKVTVLERLDRVGGRCGTIDESGFRFDIGPTFFLYPRILEEIFAACGRSLRDEVEMIRLDPQYDVVFEAGSRLRATSDRDRMRAAIAQLCPADMDGFDRFMADNRRKLAKFRPVLERPFNGPADMLSIDMLRALHLLRPHCSVDSDLARYFSDRRVRLAFSFQSKYLGMSPFQCPSLFTILAFLEYEHGIFHPRGGCGAVMQAMARVARDLGVDIRLDEPVEQIAFEGRRAVGARTARANYRGDAVVINADFAHAMRNLVPDALRRRWNDRRIARKKFSCSTFMLYLGLRGPLDGLAHHTVWLATDYAEGIGAIQDGRLPDNPSFYAQNACVTDPGLAPPGHSALYLLVPVAHATPRIDWTREMPRFRAVALRQLARLGIDDIEQRIVFERCVTPLHWEHDMAIHRGATFNLAHSFDQMLAFRPRNRFEDLENVYLVGGGTHPGSGLPVIFESARISTRLLVEDLARRPTRSPMREAALTEEPRPDLEAA